MLSSTALMIASTMGGQVITGRKAEKTAVTADSGVWEDERELAKDEKQEGKV